MRPWRELSPRARLAAAWGLLLLLLGACVTPADELRGLAEQAPLDCAVLVTGGAFLGAIPGVRGTFAAANDGAANGAAAQAPVEVIPIDAVADVLVRGNVYQRVAIDPDPARRARARAVLTTRTDDAEFESLLARARADGYDYLLVVEELQDAPIDEQGTNGRWPVTFATWLLLGVGMFIPDRTFESRAKLHVTLREVQMGRVVYECLPVAGPVELALTERTDFWGLVSSILVPPFWVGDDGDAVTSAVRVTTERRLLLSLARELKSELARQRLRDQTPATFVLRQDETGFVVVVESFEALTVARLRSERDADNPLVTQFGESLLASVASNGTRFRYTARLPDAVVGQRVQVLVGTLRGGIASATFWPGGR
jgi:hypothetical protein